MDCEFFILFYYFFQLTIFIFYFEKIQRFQQVRLIVLILGLVYYLRCYLDLCRFAINSQVVLILLEVHLLNTPNLSLVVLYLLSALSWSRRSFNSKISPSISIWPSVANKSKLLNHHTKYLLSDLFSSTSFISLLFP